MSNSKSVDRRSALIGAGIGLAALGVIAGAAGLGAPGNAGDRVLSWSGDGRQAYLWAIEGDNLRFVASARANEPGGDDKAPKDKGKGSPDDKGAGKDKGNDTDQGKGKDKGEKGEKGNKGGG